MYKKEYSVLRVWYYLQFQVSIGDLNAYLPVDKEGYCFSLPTVGHDGL